MTPERWREVEETYDAVAARPAGERADALQELCAGDEQLREEVASLLAHADDASGFLAAAGLRGRRRRQ